MAESTNDRPRYVTLETRGKLRETIARLTEHRATPKEQFGGDKSLAELNLVAYLGNYVPALLDHIDSGDEALDSLRAAWNAHMAVCPGRPDLPTQEQLEAWRNAPSNTASGGTEPIQATDSGEAS